MWQCIFYSLLSATRELVCLVLVWLYATLHSSVNPQFLSVRPRAEDWKHRLMPPRRLIPTEHVSGAETPSYQVVVLVACIKKTLNMNYTLDNLKYWCLLLVRSLKYTFKLEKCELGARCVSYLWPGSDAPPAAAEEKSSLWIRSRV